MKNLVLYSSVTGNTKALAETIFAALPEPKELHSIKDDINIDDFDRLYLGYWIKKGGCDKLTKNCWEKIHGKKILLFGTMATDVQSSYGKALMEKVAHVLPRDNKILGHFACQGTLSEELKEQYRQKLVTDPSNDAIKRQLDNEANCQNHPDATDLKKALNFAHDFS